MEHEQLIANLVNTIEDGYAKKTINTAENKKLYFLLLDAREYLYEHGWSRNGIDSSFQKVSD